MRSRKNGLQRALHGPRSLLLLGVSFALVSAFSAIPQGHRSQGPPAFDSAVIRRNVTMRRGGGWVKAPGRLLIQNQSLLSIIEDEYRLKGFQVKGAPSWLDAEVYDITGTTDAQTSWAEMKEMVNTLLAERCKLAFHRERIDRPGLALVTSKSGPSFHEYEPRPGDTPLTTGETQERGHIVGRKIAMPHLADYIERVLQVPVLDKTALPGFYHVELSFALDEKAPGDQGVVPTSLRTASLRTALEQQLGLTLVAQQVLLELFIIDHIERPDTK